MADASKLKTKRARRGGGWAASRRIGYQPECA